MPGAIFQIHHGRPIDPRSFAGRGRYRQAADNIGDERCASLHDQTDPDLAAMMLINAEALPIDDSVSKYVPAFAT